MVKDIAERVYNNLEEKQQVMVDPATMMLIVTIGKEVFKAIKKCREAKKKEIDVQQVAHNPDERQQRVVKRIVRKELGMIKYMREGDKYLNAVFKTGKDLTKQEIENAIDSAED